MSEEISFLLPDGEPTVLAQAPHHASGCYLVAPHWPYRPEHLPYVEAEMERLGSPRIRAHWDGEHWRAIEGSHRIAVAAARGTAIVLVPVELDDEFDHDQPSVGRITVRRMLSERLHLSTAFYRMEAG